jgi:hypothetical protein
VREMMDGAIYLLSRQVKGDHGESYMQNVTVFANSTTHARSIVEDQFARLRKESTTHENAYQALPQFSVEKVGLETYKMITAGITYY